MSFPTGASFPHIVMMCCGMAVCASAAHSEAPSAAHAEAPIDSILANVHAKSGIEPVGIVDDRVFLRRVTLDLIGRVPTIGEIRDFRRTRDRSKRIDDLLASVDFDQYWSQLWTSILIGRSPDSRADREALRQWIEQAFRDRIPMNQIAFDLISAQGVTSLSGPVNFMVGNREDPVTSVSRVFLGVQLDCARCHDHPYDRWTEEDYTLMRRFFQTVRIEEEGRGHQ